jgi:intraflagellar transport protein 122
MEDMLAYTGNGILYIKIQNFPATQQRLPGFVVGFKGSKIFSLHNVVMNTIDVPQSSTFYRFLENKDFRMAYKIACLGVTEQDWRALGKEALIRIRDLKFIDLTDRTESESN